MRAHGFQSRFRHFNINKKKYWFSICMAYIVCTICMHKSGPKKEKLFDNFRHQRIGGKQQRTEGLLNILMVITGIVRFHPMASIGSFNHSTRCRPFIARLMRLISDPHRTYATKIYAEKSKIYDYMQVDWQCHSMCRQSAVCQCLSLSLKLFEEEISQNFDPSLGFQDLIGGFLNESWKSNNQTNVVFPWKGAAFHHRHRHTETLNQKFWFKRSFLVEHKFIAIVIIVQNLNFRFCWNPNLLNSKKVFSLLKCCAIPDDPDDWICSYSV